MYKQPYDLLVDIMESGDMNYLIENKNETSKDKVYRIRGPFLMCETRNRNGRIYKKSIVAPQVSSYTENYIKKSRALGSLDHPEFPTLLYKNSAILTESLVEDGNLYIGCAKVLSTPDGMIMKSLMDDDIQISVSSRALGSMSSDGYVNDNFRLIAVDACVDPSAVVATMESIKENFEYFLEGDTITRIAVQRLQKDLAKNGSRSLKDDLTRFINTLKNKI
jgi:hypothetical protein